jgi:hypothetical protein
VDGDEKDTGLDRKIVHDLNGHAAVILANLQALTKYTGRLVAMCPTVLEQAGAAALAADERKRIEAALADTPEALDDALGATRELIDMLRKL